MSPLKKEFCEFCKVIKKGFFGIIQTKKEIAVSGRVILVF